LRFRAALGWGLGIVARVWLATLRVTLETAPELLRDGVQPWILVFFHGTQWPLLAWPRRRRTLVMVSHSADGQMQSWALGVLGFAVVRGSSSRGGARALAAMVRALRKGEQDAAFAVDGPRGPYGVAKEGAIVAARRAVGILVPMGSAMRHGKTFERAWDRFALAWPFSRVAVVLGAPLPATATAIQVAAAIHDANARARALVSCM
jgi:lysophospholipid acyltransferase (LPLAT)-like uncharacterized protein